LGSLGSLGSYCGRRQLNNLRFFFCSFIKKQSIFLGLSLAIELPKLPKLPSSCTDLFAMTIILVIKKTRQDSERRWRYDDYARQHGIIAGRNAYLEG
jgi:hypothetical protein